MDETCSTHGRNNKCIQKFWRRPKGNIPLGSTRRWEDITKMCIKEIWREGVDWIKLAQDKIQWGVLMNTVMKNRVP